jgi:hypothetical protein
MGPDPRDRPFDLAGALPGADRSDLGGQRPEQTQPLFAYGFVVSNGWIVQNPSINGYSGAFGYNLSNGVTIVVAATTSKLAPPTRSPLTFSAMSQST